MGGSGGGAAGVAFNETMHSEDEHICYVESGEISDDEDAGLQELLMHEAHFNKQANDQQTKAADECDGDVDNDEENGQWWQDVNGAEHCDISGSSSDNVENDNCVHASMTLHRNDTNSTVNNSNTTQRQDDDGQTREGALRRRTRTHAAWTELARTEMVLRLQRQGAKDNPVDVDHQNVEDQNAPT